MSDRQTLAGSEYARENLATVTDYIDGWRIAGPRSLFRQHGKAGPSTGNDDQDPTGERDCSGEPRRGRRGRRKVPFMRAASRNELEDQHIDSGEHHDGQLDLENRLAEIF